jgi:glutathione S-transferase
MSLAKYLDAAFPEALSLFPGPHALVLAQLADHILSNHVMLPSLRVKWANVPAILDEPGAEYWHRTHEEMFGVMLEELCSNLEAEWTVIEKELAVFTAILAGLPLAPRQEHEPFLMGVTPSYADFLLVVFFQWFKVSGQQEWVPTVHFFLPSTVIARCTCQPSFFHS